MSFFIAFFALAALIGLSTYVTHLSARVKALSALAEETYDKIEDTNVNVSAIGYRLASLKARTNLLTSSLSAVSEKLNAVDQEANRAFYTTGTILGSILVRVNSLELLAARGPILVYAETQEPELSAEQLTPSPWIKPSPWVTPSGQLLLGFDFGPDNLEESDGY